MVYQPKTGQPCTCKRGVERDNCPMCEGTGQRIDFKAIRARVPRPYVEILASDVDNDTFRAFGHVWLVSDFIGRIMPQDVGKRVYKVGDILQVENDKQRAARVQS